MARQIVDNRKHARVALAVIGAGLVWVALLAAALPSLPARALASNSSPSVTPQTAFLYRFDPNTFSFFTRTLPLGSVPIDVAVTGTSPVHVWVTLFGSDKIGRLVFTSTAQTSWTEYAVTSTANSQPFQLALRGNEVWFTEQNANRVGRLNALTGQIDEFFGNGLSSDSGLAGIDIAPDGSIWLAGQKSNRLIRLVVTDTNDFAFQQYTLGSTTGPYAVAIESDNSIHFSAPASNSVGFLTPSLNQTVLAPGIPPNHYPTDITWDSAHEASWFSEPSGGRIGLFFKGTLGIPAQFGPITRPVGLSRFSGNTLWVTQQDAIGQLARMVYTYPATVNFTSYPLPTRGLFPTGVALAGDGSVWLAAYAPERSYVPAVMRNAAP
ncbi:MAG TPA: hypothetical protein VIK33_11265 [Anaerolineae bacterium]